MKRIPFTLLAAVLALSVFSACSMLAPPTSDLDAQTVELTAQAFAAAAQAADETATAAAAAPATEAPPPVEEEAPPIVEEAPPEEALPTATLTPSEFEMTLAAAATAQAPTLWAGQTLAAQTQAALPTATPLVFDIASSTTTETIVENEIEITVTAIVPPEMSLPQAWTEIYAAPVGLPFSITTDEEAMALAIETALYAAGYGENISDLTVSLNNGLITVEFTVTFGPTGADGRITFSAYAENGQAIITMTSLQFGRFTVPDELLNAVNVAIAQALTGASDASQAQVTIDEIFIDDGIMIISGVVGI
jgi:hypothetical protein